MLDGPWKAGYYFGVLRNTEMNEVFQALSDPTRREILRLLHARDMTAGELAQKFPLAKSTLSGHFAALRHAGLIVAEKTGTSIVYSLNLSVVEQTLSTVMDLLDVGGSRNSAGGRKRTPRKTRKRVKP